MARPTDATPSVSLPRSLASRLLCAERWLSNHGPENQRSRRHRARGEVYRADHDQRAVEPAPSQSIVAAYCPTWNVKLPSVVCVSIESTRHVTW